MKFHKYRQNFASGKGKWEFATTAGWSEELIAESLNDEYSWSDKYRGCDVEMDAAPPQEWLEKTLEELKRNLQYINRDIKELESLIAQK